MRFKHIEGQLARWLEELAQFDMEIVHRPGKKHLNADGLSRIPDCLEDCDCYNAGADVENLPCKGCQYCQRAHTQWSRFLNDVDDVIPLAKRQVSPLEVKIVSVEENPNNQSDESVTSSIQGLQASSFNSADSIDHDMTQLNTEEDTIHINWMQSYSPQQLRQLQLQDPDLFPLIEWIESQYDPSDAELRLQSPATRALRLLGSCLKIDSSTKIGYSKKLRSPWIGPYLVVSDHFPLYTIKDRKGESVIHHDRLKKCNDREIPLWLRRLRRNMFNDTSFVHADESTDEDTQTASDNNLLYCGGQLLQNLDLVSDVSLNDDFQQLFIDQENSDDEEPQGLLASSTNDDFLISEVQGTRSPTTSHDYPCTRRG
ncbi:unnamed protein product [Mytilus edulis]|uniref:Uncharacterized protein n=1 Tax=Mytilus edulis TaxID=6550 RepID=A0A8S3V2L6_MYTED|nr:unnamed protein product [Mytilus edulis]